jgi:hypothetical protein
VHSSEGQKDGSRRMLSRDCREDEGKQSTPIVAIASLVSRLVCGLASCRSRTWFIFVFGWTLRIRCFNFFNVCKYRSELIESSSCMTPDRTPDFSQGRQLQQWGGLFSLILPTVST